MLVYGVIHDQRSNWSDVDVWDVSSGRLLHTVDSMIHCPQAINFSPVGRLFATAALDVTKIWDASLLGTLGKPTDTLKKMFLSRDIQQLAFLTTD
jgi:WD40 repeat protein